MASTSLKRIRHDLKEWEHTFSRLHGRAPSKADIKASPSIRALYREYACLKNRAQAQTFQNEYMGGQLSGDKENVAMRGFERTVCGTILPQPSSPSTHSSHSNGSQGTHISATPPKKKSDKYAAATHDAGIGTPTETLKGQMGVTSKRLKAAQLRSTVLCDIVGNSQARVSSQAPMNCQEDEMCLASTTKAPAKVLTCRNLNLDSEKKKNDGDSEKQTFCPETSPLGFTIKMQRCGEHKDASNEIENGFFVNRISSFRPGTKSLSRRITAGTQRLEIESCNASPGRPNVLETEPGERVTGGSCPPCSDDNRSIPGSIDVCTTQALTDPKEVLAYGPCELAGVKEEDLDVDNLTVDHDGASLSKLTVLELRKMLVAQGLSPTGKKPALIARLEKSNVNAVEPHTRSHKRKTKDNGNKTLTCESQRNLDNASLSETSLLTGTQNDNAPHMGIKQIIRGKSRLDVKQPDSSASFRKKATLGFVNWHSVKRTDCLTRKAGARENFVKLNIGGNGRRAQKFVNRAGKRKLGACGNRFHSRKKQKKQETAVATAQQDVELNVVEDLDGNLLEPADMENFIGNVSGQSSMCPSALGGNPDAQVEGHGNAHDHGNGKCAFEPLANVAAKVLGNPTESSLLEVLHKVFGYRSFRPGQLETIQRILAGQSTMLVLPTGSGKSLCYQLPAFLLPGITLVISPLVALMIDQLRHLPPLLPGAALSGSQTQEEFFSALDRLRSGVVKVLFVSPERFLCDNFLSLLEGLPLVSLAVVDEAHCLSEWSHNFRPSYFRLGGVLRQKLNVDCLLAMTATATKETLNSILHSLSIPSSGLVQVSHIRENLHCSVSWSDNRLKDLLLLLQSSPFLEAKSIIVYCKFQFEADNVSGFLRDNGIQAKSYHGGMTPLDRRRIQELFCCNKLRVVVGTVAFGLGLDKSDVHAVIHFGLPNSLEHYVQETGRAGRDGEPAHCHLFLENHSYLKLRSLAYSESVDGYTLNKFLSRIFNGSSVQNKSWHISSFLIEPTARDLDLKEEVMATVLSYLEVGEVQYGTVLPQLKATCTLQFHKNSPVLLARKSALINAILERSQSKQGQYVFDLPSLANFMGLKLSDLQQQLQELQVAGEVTFTFKDPAFCFHVLKVPEDLNSLASRIAERFAEMECLKVKKLDFMFMTAAAAAGQDKTTVSPECSLQETIKNYFQLEGLLSSCNPPSVVKYSSPFLKADIKVFLKANSHANFTSRAIARIFHGISSSAYPSSTWSRNHFWGRYTNIDFNSVKEAVALEMKALRGL